MIEIEQAWIENYLTLDGRIMHENAHNGLELERRGERLISRGLPVSSHQLGFTGKCDVVEYTKTSESSGVYLHDIEGKYLVSPIEYKRGKVKVGEEDEMQVAAQAIALEEMLSASIEKAYIFYGRHQRRHEVLIDTEIRRSVQEIADEMHDYSERAYVPKVRYQSKCKSCSLFDICMPQLYSSTKVDSYIKEYSHEETT